MLPDLRPLAEMSRTLGSNPGLVQGKGGNTSLKLGGMLYVKSSGARLRDVSVEDFIPLELASVMAIMESGSLDGRAARERLLGLSSSGAPSIETFLHAVMPGAYVAHLHPVYSNAIGCMVSGEALCTEIFGTHGLVYTDYAMPGYEVGLKLHQALKSHKGDSPHLALMANHGLIVAAESTEAIASSLSICLGKIESRLGSIPEPKPAHSHDSAFADMLGRVTGGHARWALCPYANMLALEPELFVGPLFPDQIVYCGHMHPELSGDESEAQAGAVCASFKEASGYEPRYLTVSGAGVILLGRDSDELALREEILGAYAKVSLLIRSTGVKPKLIPEAGCSALLFGEGGEG